MDVQRFYDELRRSLVAWAQEQPEMRALIVVGSRARQVKPADEYADLDLNVFVTEESKDNDRFIQWMRAYAPIWMSVLERRDETRNWLILYQGGIKVDFAISPTSELQRLVDQHDLWDDQIRGYEVLLDKDGLAAQLPPAKLFEAPPYSPPSQTQFVQRVENFFYGAVYVAKQIKRNNLWKIKWADQYQQSFLLEMLEWHAHATHDEPIDTYFRGDFMRDWVSETTWQELHRVYAHFDAQDSWRALMASVELFIRLADETAAALSYPYPRQMIGEVSHYLETLGQQVGPPGTLT